MPSPAQPFLLPRGLIFLASLWLIGSWLIVIGLRPPVHPSSSSYEPGVRLILLSLVIGLMIGWPLLRLSQAMTIYPIRQTLVDLVVLLAMVQVVIWPLRLVTTWSIERTAAIDATTAGWVILAGAVVASAVGTERRGPRNLAMLVCLALCLLGPGLAALGAVGGVELIELVELSPLVAVRSLTDGGGAPIVLDQWRLIALLGGAAIAAWVMLTLWTIGSGRNDEPQTAEDAATPNQVRDQVG